MADGKVFLQPHPDFGGEREMLSLPDDPGDGWTVAYEVTSIVQRAYELGRTHQMEIIERESALLFSSIRKQSKVQRP